MNIDDFRLLFEGLDLDIDSENRKRSNAFHRGDEKEEKLDNINDFEALNGEIRVDLNEIDEDYKEAKRVLEFNLLDDENKIEENENKKNDVLIMENIGEISLNKNVEELSKNLKISKLEVLFMVLLTSKNLELSDDEFNQIFNLRSGSKVKNKVKKLKISQKKENEFRPEIQNSDIGEIYKLYKEIEMSDCTTMVCLQDSENPKKVMFRLLPIIPFFGQNIVDLHRMIIESLIIIGLGGLESKFKPDLFQLLEFVKQGKFQFLSFISLILTSEGESIRSKIVAETVKILFMRELKKLSKKNEIFLEEKNMFEAYFKFFHQVTFIKGIELGGLTADFMKHFSSKGSLLMELVKGLSQPRMLACFLTSDNQKRDDMLKNLISIISSENDPKSLLTLFQDVYYQIIKNDSHKGFLTKIGFIPFSNLMTQEKKKSDPNKKTNNSPITFDLEESKICNNLTFKQSLEKNANHIFDHLKLTEKTLGHRITQLDKSMPHNFVDDVHQFIIDKKSIKLLILVNLSFNNEFALIYSNGVIKPESDKKTIYIKKTEESHIAFFRGNNVYLYQTQNENFITVSTIQGLESIKIFNGNKEIISFKQGALCSERFDIYPMKPKAGTNTSYSFPSNRVVKNIEFYDVGERVSFSKVTNLSFEKYILGEGRLNIELDTLISEGFVASFPSFYSLKNLMKVFRQKMVRFKNKGIMEERKNLIGYVDFKQLGKDETKKISEIYFKIERAAKVKSKYSRFVLEVNLAENLFYSIRSDRYWRDDVEKAISTSDKDYLFSEFLKQILIKIQKSLKRCQDLDRDKKLEWQNLISSLIIRSQKDNYLLFEIFENLHNLPFFNNQKKPNSKAVIDLLSNYVRVRYNVERRHKDTVKHDYPLTRLHYKKKDKNFQTVVNIPEPSSILSKFARSIDLLDSEFEFDDYIFIASSYFFSFLEYLMNKKELIEEDEKCRKLLLHIFKNMVKKDQFFPLLVSLDDSLQPSQESTLFDKMTYLEKLEGFQILSRNARERSYKLGFRKKHNTDQKFDLMEINGDRMFRRALSGFIVRRCQVLNLKGVHKHEFYNEIIKVKNLDNQIVTKLNQEIKLMKEGLPCESSNSIFVKVDAERTDVMKVLIIGSKDTPYAYGCFTFDIWFNKDYPNKAPSCKIMTGRGKIRFNPNLYSTGKVCLSLLGTWPGDSYQKWIPNKSNLLQVLLSIQSLIMHEDIYYNEPSFGNYKGSSLHDQRNNAYCKIAMYGTVKYAMIDAIKDETHPFHDVIKAHFFINKKNIFDQIAKWEQNASIGESYTGISQSHNRVISGILRNQKFKLKLNELTNELRTTYASHINADCLKFLDTIFTVDIQNYYNRNKKSFKKSEEEDIDKMIDIEAVQKEVEKMNKVKLSLKSYDDEEETEIFTSKKRKIDVLDEKTQQTFSRYIGVVGIEALALQAKAKVLLVGLDQLGLEIAKNVVLSSLDTFAVFDDRKIKEIPNYKFGMFFLKPDDDISLNVCEVILPRIQELHSFVTVKREKKLTEKILEKYDIVVACNQKKKTVFDSLSSVCRAYNKPLIVADTEGLYARVVNSFGEKFEVMDTTGENLEKCSISKIDQTKIQLLENFRAFSQGDEIMLYVEGKEKNEFEMNKVKSVNEGVVELEKTISKKKKFDKVSQVKRKTSLKNLNIHRVYGSVDVRNFEDNLYYYDHEKSQNNLFLNLIFSLIRDPDNDFKKLKSKGHFSKFHQFCLAKFKTQMDEIGKKEEAEDEKNLKKFKKFMINFLTFSRYYFHPVDAFVGGIVAQEILKAATHKFKPIDQIFTMDFSDLGDSLFDEINEDERNFSTIADFRKKYLDLLNSDKIKNSTLLVVGSGAIGCELLKNLSQINCSSGEKGKLYLTDPDFIEISNLNRQFLFRERHLRKPKSLIAAASILTYNPKIKIKPLLEKVEPLTENIFNDEFWSQLDCVANALDNIKARKYVDIRCVKNLKPLVESGTLGAKGHIQTIVPFKTETYGDVQDAEEHNGADIPYCTLKLFPEKAEHCIEWARDKFETLFKNDIESAKKIIEMFTDKEFSKRIEKLFQNKKIIQELKEAVEEILKSMDYINCKKGLLALKYLPVNQKECVLRAAEIFNKYFLKAPTELLAAYPLDMVDGEGKPFWRAPKRPPNQVNFEVSLDWHKKLIIAIVDIYSRIGNIPGNFDNYLKFTETIMVKKVEEDESTFQGILQKITKGKTSGLLTKEEIEKIKKKVNNQEAPEEEDNVDKLVTYMKDIIKKYKFVQDPKDYFKKMLENIKPEIFDKDTDSNGHIDVIYGFTNCRAQSYNIQTTDRITVKLKSGRIIPAMVTTTACISALETMEIFKVLTIDYKKKKEKKDDDEEEVVHFRNSFLNLALPFMTRSDPAPPLKSKFEKMGLDISIWNVLEGKIHHDIVIRDLLELLKKKLSDLEQIVYQGKTVYHNELSDKNQLELSFRQACKLPFGENECEVFLVDKKGVNMRLKLSLCSKMEENVIDLKLV